MKLEKLKPAMVVFDVGKQKMGNTKMTTIAVWPVYIIDVDLERRRVSASRNNNSPQYFREHQVAKWRAKRPALVKEPFGRMRLATRDEQKALNNEKANEQE